MAIIALIAFFFGFLAFNLGGTAPGSGTGTYAEPATLSVKAAQPLVVAGSGFLPRERVRVSVDGVAKRTRAGRAGRLVVRFSEVDACNGGTIVARGSLGSRAQLNFAQFSNIHCL